MYYTNCALQHRNFNQDEWLAIEDWVKDLRDDATDRISVFAGPMYGGDDGGAGPTFVRPSGGCELAEVPAAFFKIVAFIGKDRDVAVRAFVAVQDADALSGMRGRREDMFTLCTYQVSVRMIELETGIVFPKVLRDKNPLYCTPPLDGTCRFCFLAVHTGGSGQSAVLWWKLSRRV